MAVSTHVAGAVAAAAGPTPESTLIQARELIDNLWSLAGSFICHDSPINKEKARVFSHIDQCLAEAPPPPPIYIEDAKPIVDPNAATISRDILYAALKNAIHTVQDEKTRMELGDKFPTVALQAMQEALHKAEEYVE